MAVTVLSSGTQTATIGTEHILADTAAAGTYQFYVDPAAMVAGDVLELRVYKMALSGGTRRVVYSTRIAGGDLTADNMGRISVPISTALTDSGAVRFTLKQTAGTGRAFPWTVEKFA